MERKNRELQEGTAVEGIDKSGEQIYNMACA